MTDQLKVYSFSAVGFFQYFLDILNPLMSFILLFITILYTYQKYKTEKKKHNE
jgi:tellurite resistance protein TehA-like permease